MTRRDIERMTIFTDGTTAKAACRSKNALFLLRNGYKPYGRMCISGRLHLEVGEDGCFTLIYGVKSAIKGKNGNYKYFGLARKYRSRRGLNISIKLLMQHLVGNGSEKWTPLG